MYKISKFRKIFLIFGCTSSLGVLINTPDDNFLQLIQGKRYSENLYGIDDTFCVFKKDAMCKKDKDAM